MSKFRVQWSDDIKNRSVESPKGPYKVCLEGYFDFNEALVKLMVMNGDMFPKASQFEPYSDSDDESDMDFSEPQFDDVCDAIEESRRLTARLEAMQASQAYVKGKGDDSSSPKPKNVTVDPVNEVTE